MEQDRPQDFGVAVSSLHGERQKCNVIDIRHGEITTMDQANILQYNAETQPPSPPCRRATRLRTAFDVRRLIARTINQLMRDEIPEGKAAKIGYLANILLHAIEISEMEDRISKLEKGDTAWTERNA